MGSHLRLSSVMLCEKYVRGVSEGTVAGVQVKFLRATSGARIAYAVVGSGPPLVLLPPWSSHLELFWEMPGFRRLCEGFAAEHTVVMYDRWGTGLSDRSRRDMSDRPVPCK